MAIGAAVNPRIGAGTPSHERGEAIGSAEGEGEADPAAEGVPSEVGSIDPNSIQNSKNIANAGVRGVRGWIVRRVALPLAARIEQDETVAFL